jgi:beta propeller repeat protein
LAPGFQTNPVIDGSRIAWTDTRNGNYDIYLYDIGSSSEARITADPAQQYAPALSGDLLAWVDWRNGNPDIYALDLATGEEIAVCTELSGQWSPSVYGNRVVWGDDRNGYADIYGAAILRDTDPPVVSISASPSVLSPPTGLMVPVTVSGSAEDVGSGIASLVFSVVDEYGLVQPPLTAFGETIYLLADRTGEDKDGRTYTITVTATDGAGNQSVASTIVTVPHSKPKVKPGPGKGPNPKGEG